MPESVAELTGVEKASLLLIALGSDTASRVLQHLAPDEVQRLCAQIAKQEKVDQGLQEQVLVEFARGQDVASIMGGMGYAQELLEQSVGPIKAKELLEEIAVGSGGRPFDWLVGSKTPRLANCLQNERPQVIALVLAHLPADQAADVMSQLPEDVQGRVAYRLTAMQPVPREIVRAVEEAVRVKLAKEGTGDLREVGGLQALVTILNNADRPTESKILEYLEQTEASIAESVREMLFVFEDIVNLDDRALQVVIREVEQEDMRLSLKGASDEMKEVFFKNMSERAAEAMKEDLEMMGPVKVRDVEAARRRMLAVIRRLEEAGEITLRQDEEEEEVVT